MEEEVHCGISGSKQGEEGIGIGRLYMVQATEAKEREKEGVHVEVEAGQRGMLELKQDEKDIATTVWHAVECQSWSRVEQAPT